MSGDDAGDVVSFAPAQTGDQAKVTGTLVSAFIDDPVERWLWPEAHEYLTYFPAFVTAFGSEAFTRQTVWTLGGFAAVAWWIPPGVEPDEQAIIAVLTRSSLRNYARTPSRCWGRWTRPIHGSRTGTSMRRPAR